MPSLPLSVLYVEDDRDLALLVKEHLTQAGFRVEVAYDGQEALARLAAGSYDLLAIDQTLPGLDGLGVLRAIAADGPLPPTVMVTGTGNEQVAVQTMKLGADDYIVKDSGGGWLRLLPSVIQRVLRQRRIVEEKKAAETALLEANGSFGMPRSWKAWACWLAASPMTSTTSWPPSWAMPIWPWRSLPTSEPARDDVAEVKKASQRAADLTRQMLAYSGKCLFFVEPISLSRSVQELGRMLEVSVAQRAELRLNLDADLPAVRADAAQINQVIMNLVINAAESLQEPGVISITTDVVQCRAEDLAGLSCGQEPAAGPYVRLAVADTGCGMDEPILAKIFDPFFTTKFTGRGLGLAAVQGIVHGHKGAIRVTSRPGQGTTFEVFLPAAGPVPPPVAREAAVPRVAGQEDGAGCRRRRHDPHAVGSHAGAPRFLRAHGRRRPRGPWNSTASMPRRRLRVVGPDHAGNGRSRDLRPAAASQPRCPRRSLERL